MSEVKRYAPNYTETGRYLNMAENAAGEFVTHSDYAAVKAERDELAHFANGWDTSLTWDSAAGTFRCRGCGKEKRIGIACDHAPGCPVALAEKIVEGEKP